MAFPAHWWFLERSGFIPKASQDWSEIHLSHYVVQVPIQLRVLLRLKLSCHVLVLWSCMLEPFTVCLGPIEMRLPRTKPYLPSLSLCPWDAELSRFLPASATCMDFWSDNGGSHSQILSAFFLVLFQILWLWLSPLPRYREGRIAMWRCGDLASNWEVDRFPLLACSWGSGAISAFSSRANPRI